MRPASLVPWLLLVALVPVLPAHRAAADTVPELPPRIDFPAQADTLEAAGDPSALVQAALRRRALGQPERAVADIDRYLSLLAASPERAGAAADLFVTEILDPETWPDPARWQDTLRRFLSAAKNATSPTIQSARVRAEVLLAAHLWQISCSLDPAQRSDVACIQRIDAVAELEAERRAVKEAVRRGETPPSSKRDFCEPSNRYRYVVHPRRAALAGEAQSLLTQALRRARALTKALRQDAALQEAYAHALFLRSEPRFEAALAYRLPRAFHAELARSAGLKPPRQAPFLRSWNKTWLKARTNVSYRVSFREPAVREQPFYQSVVDLGVPAWSVAAYARLAQLSLNVTDQFRSSFMPLPSLPPPPAGLDQAEWPMLFQNAYCSFPSEDLMFERETRDAVFRCDDEAHRAGIDSPYLRICFDLHQRPFDTNEANEIFAAPTWHNPLAQARSGLASSPE